MFGDRDGRKLRALMFLDRPVFRPGDVQRKLTMPASRAVFHAEDLLGIQSSYRADSLYAGRMMIDGVGEVNDALVVRFDVVHASPTGVGVNIPCVFSERYDRRFWLQRLIAAKSDLPRSHVFVLANRFEGRGRCFM